MWYFAPILNAAILDAKANAPAGKSYSQYSLMKNGGNDIVFAEDLIVPSSVAAMQAKRAAIKSGAFKVPVDHSQPV
jgi:hypothetical protein